MYKTVLNDYVKGVDIMCISRISLYVDKGYTQKMFLLSMKLVVGHVIFQAFPSCIKCDQLD